MMKPAYECDVTPNEPGHPFAPRVRFNFDNGWTASVIFRVRGDGFDALHAMLAHWPTGRAGKGKTVLGETEASPDEVAAFLTKVSTLPPPGPVS